MSAFPPGHLVNLPDMPGRWQVWSQSNETPGAYFFIAYDEVAREAGVKYVVAKAIAKKADPRPEITVLRVQR